MGVASMTRMARAQLVTSALPAPAYIQSVAFLIFRLDCQYAKRPRWFDAECRSPKRPRDVLLHTGAALSNAARRDLQHPAFFAEETIAEKIVDLENYRVGFRQCHELRRRR